MTVEAVVTHPPTVVRQRGPSLLALVSDPLRAGAEFATWPALAQLARLAPKSDGEPVLVLPGLLASDTSTRPLRGWLRRLGWHVHGWRLGRNVGPTRAVADGLRARIGELTERHGQPVSVLGWSLGGIYARAAASERPDLVRQVITLGTPFAMDDPRQTRAYRRYQRYQHLHAPGYGLPMPAGVRGRLPVPAASIWSREDGIVSWTASLEKPSATSENIAVHGSHLGLGHNPAVLWAVADRLACPIGDWRPFRPPAWLRPLYPAVPSSRP